MKVLIVGYGRAGKRHVAYLERELSDHVSGLAIVDPALFMEYPSVQSTLSTHDFDLAVICTPPDSHLENIREILDGGIPKILCEKPLCGLGQLDEAVQLAERAGDRVSVAYNWRWHPQLRGPRETYPGGYGWNISSVFHRPDLPEWGLLLDHVAHSVDTLRYLSRAEKTEEVVLWEAKHGKVVFEDPTKDRLKRDEADNRDIEYWQLIGHVNGIDFRIKESVWLTQFYPRSSVVGWPDEKEIELDLSPETLNEMFLGMWGDVLNWAEGRIPPPVSMRDAVETQIVLEKAQAMSNG